MSSKPPTISINGKILKAENASIPVLDSGLLTGYGIFETLLAENHNEIQNIYRLKEHLARFENSRKTLGLSRLFTKNQIKDFLIAALNNTSAKNHYNRIRITQTAGNSGKGLWGNAPIDGSLIIIIQEHKLARATAKPKAEIISSATPLNFLAAHKSTSRMPYSHPSQIRTTNSQQILYHPDLGATEFTNAALFIRKGSNIITAPDNSVFPSITRAQIIKNFKAIAPDYKLQKRKIQISDLLNADEIIALNSLNPVISISQLTDKTQVSSKASKKVITYDKPKLSPNFREFLLSQ